MSDTPAADWFTDAVFYQVHVKAFADATGDGIGDFAGLAGKLDYIQQLGVTAIWLMPFFPSPLRDDGYDIADYNNVNSMYGDLAGFRILVREAHKRDLKVIIELVINHTSDEHPWFQRARRAAPGSVHRDFYVWSDTNTRYGETRIIFEDFETSNWTWDPVAGQYFWHRFYSHQPDLNFDNPAVHREVFKAMDRWLSMGVDGVRLDAIPYLYERDGTNCENLPETHAFLKQLRARIDERFPNRMLLAEANQWPEDAVEYFGDGDECHMAFHFPLMPRLYMALEMEDSRPIVDILAQTPPIPDHCQWAMFLRNHDELTLEMVTDEERVSMRRAYAPDPRMRINLGIRRRLAPLMQNDRRRIELMNVLLFSMPGTPVVYYGDEIGMGDNVYLPDRDGVRTPMQWNADRNAGFSTANPHQLYLPVIADPQYHYAAVNVEAQRANPSSLWWWMHDLIAMRRRHSVMAHGGISFIDTDNAKVLAFRRHGAEPSNEVVIVVNLSRHPQSARLNLPDAGATPVELFGETRFPTVGDEPYPLTLAPYGFYWLRLDRPELMRVADLDVPSVTITLARGRLDLTDRATQRTVEKALARWVQTRPWFRRFGRTVQSVTLVDTLSLSVRPNPASLTVIDVRFTQGDRDRYAVPVAVVRADEAETGVHVERVIAPLSSGGALVDGMAVETVVAALARLADRAETTSPAFRTWHSAGSHRPAKSLGSLELVGSEERTTTAVLGNTTVVELRRLMAGGVSADVDLADALVAGGFQGVAPPTGRLDFHPDRGEPSTVLVTHRYITHDTDLLTVFESRARDYFDTIRARAVDAAPRAFDLFDPIDAARVGDLFAAAGSAVELAAEVGRFVAELHAALINLGGSPPQPFTSLYQRSLYQVVTAAAKRLSRTSVFADLGFGVHDIVDRVMSRADEMRGPKLDIVRSPVHGNLHLGRMLWDGRQVTVVDISGDVTEPVEMRIIKRSPLVDVARMLVSIDRVGADVAAQFAEHTPAGSGDLDTWAGQWVDAVSTVFWQSYRQRLGEVCSAAVIPDDRATSRSLLDVYRFEILAAEVITADGADRTGLGPAGRALARLVARFP